MKKTLRFRSSQVPPQSTELARAFVIQGPDRGSTFVLLASGVTLGRGEEADIHIADLKASRQHARIALNGDHWNVEDLGSSNGVNVNGKLKARCPLKSGDQFTVGETTFQFWDPRYSQLQAPADPNQLRTYKERSSAIKKQVRSIQKTGGLSDLKSVFGKSSGPKAAGGGSRAVIVRVLLVGLLGVLLFVDDGKDKKRKNSRPYDSNSTGTRDLASLLPPAPELANRSADRFFKLGFREFVEGNYQRAKDQFDTALQIDPNHMLARLYLQNSNKAINEEITFHLQKGRENRRAGKLKQAKIHYESILRLLHYEKSQKEYDEAQNQLNEINLILGERE